MTHFTPIDPLAAARILASTDNYEQAERMMSWPGTPGMEAFITGTLARYAMINHLNTPGREYEGSPDFRIRLMDEPIARETRDMLIMLTELTDSQITLAEIVHDLRQTVNYSKWAEQIMNRGDERVRDHKYPNNTIRLMILRSQLARAAESPSSIGLCVETSIRTDIPRRANLTFRRLPRHHSWMGMEPALQKVRGAPCVVIASDVQPPNPAYVLAFPRNTSPPAQIPGLTNTRPPGEQNQRLQEILEYQEASKVVWLDPALIDLKQIPPLPDYLYPKDTEQYRNTDHTETTEW